MKLQSSLICYRHRQSGSTAYRLQIKPALTCRGLRLTAMPRPGLPLNGRHCRDPWITWITCNDLFTDTRGIEGSFWGLFWG